MLETSKASLIEFINYNTLSKITDLFGFNIYFSLDYKIENVKNK